MPRLLFPPGGLGTALVLPVFFKVTTGAEMGRTKFLRDKDLLLKRETKLKAKRARRETKRRSLLNHGSDPGKG